MLPVSHNVAAFVDTGGCRFKSGSRCGAKEDGMSQLRADARGPGAVRARPMSPHLQVWRWHITMFASIATRASGVALYVGLLIVVGLALSLAAGPDVYATFAGLLRSPLGLIVLFGITMSIFYHLAAGVRHLAFDSGKGFLPSTANMTAWLCIAFAVVASVSVFAIGLMLRS